MCTFQWSENANISVEKRPKLSHTMFALMLHNWITELNQKPENIRTHKQPVHPIAIITKIVSF